MKEKSNTQWGNSMLSDKTRARLAEWFILFVIGGFLYALVEVAARGFTYPAMIIVGGICFILIGGLNEVCGDGMSLSGQMLISAIMVTAVEFVSGMFLNRLLRMNIWDYSDDPYNLLGQISLKTSVYWFFLALAGILIDDFLRRVLFGAKKRKYKIF